MSSARLFEAMAGALVAGLGLSALLIAGERKSGTPSELVELEREGARKLGLQTTDKDQLPDAGEQAVVQAGHLLSVAAGAAYVATTEEDSGVIAGGIGFGLAFYAAMHCIAGPLLGLKKPEWRSNISTIGMHMLNHLAFGLATAAGARLAAAR